MESCESMERREQDEQYMRRCLELAGRGAGYVSPNPMVGCVVVRGGEVIAEGWHERHGGPHAEPNALNRIPAGTPLGGATLYVNLEPCNHHGKTPPCSELIIARGVGRVVVGCEDPNPRVSGSGIARLHEAGIGVTVGVLETEARFLNRRFITAQTLGRPYVVLKWAQTSDGFLDALRPATVPPAWMTGERARELVHRWRFEEGVVMVGPNTVAMDDPQLTVRAWGGGKLPDPLRVTMEGLRTLSASRRIFDGQAPTLLFTRDAAGARQRLAGHANVEISAISSDWNALHEILQALLRLGHNSVFAEGGAHLLGSLLEAGLWDEARIFTSDLAANELYPSLPFTGGVPAPVLPPSARRGTSTQDLFPGLEVFYR